MRKGASPTSFSVRSAENDACDYKYVRPLDVKIPSRDRGRIFGRATAAKQTSP